jgi:hypothetical protein
MSLDRKIISEIERYRNINKYITEQALDAAAPPPPADPAADLGAVAPPPPADPAAAAPPPPAADATPQPIDVANDPDVEKIDDDGKSEEKTDDEESGSDTDKKLGEYIIHIFGRTADGKSVYGKILNFTPYFFLPQNLPQNYQFNWYRFQITRYARTTLGIKI